MENNKVQFQKGLSMMQFIPPMTFISQVLGRLVSRLFQVNQVAE